MSVRVTKKRAAVVAVVVLAAAGAVLGLRARGTSGAAAGAPSAAAAKDAARHAHVVWKKGAAHHYRFAWHAASKVTTEGTTLDGDVALSGELVVRGLGAAAAASPDALVAVQIAQLSEERVTMLGKDAIAAGDAGSAAGQEALAVVTDAGAVSRVHLPRSASPLVKAVLRGLVVQLGTTASPPDVRMWAAEEVGPAGDASVVYLAEEGGSFTRTRRSYGKLLVAPALAAEQRTDTLADHGGGAVGPDGTLLRLDDDETFTTEGREGEGARVTLRNVLSLAHLRTEAFAAPELASVDASRFETVRAGELASAASDGASLAKLAEGLTVEILEDRVSLAQPGKASPNGFVTRGAAFLTLHPEACDALVGYALDNDVGARGRELTADLLASAGTKEAQRALRTLVTAPAVLADPVLARRLVQRFSLVGAPEKETVAFLTTRYGAARSAHDDDAALAAAYAMGSTARKLAKKGDAEEASRAVGTLVRDLRAASKTPEKKGLLTALGNAAPREEERTLADYTHDGDPTVRAAAAHALRGIDTASARATLEGLASDADPAVGREALGALGAQKLAPEDAATLADAVVNGSVPLALAPDLVTFFASHREPRGAVERALRALAARTPNDPGLQARIDAVLQGMGFEGL